MKKEIIDTLKKLLSYKTYEENTEEFEKLFNYIKEKFKNLEINEYTFKDKKAMVLSNTDSKDLDIIFCTHIDVVYDDTYEFTEDEDNIYGRGTIDMKGSVAVLLTLFKNIKTDLKIALFITSDEEIDGNCAYELSKIYNSKLAIVPDGGSDFELIKEEKGLIQLELSAKGKPAHSAQLFNGENAIIKLMNVYNEIVLKYPIPKSSDEYITSVNLSKLNGGNSNNQVPDYASMILDIRYINKDKDNIIEFIKNIDKEVDVKVLTIGSAFVTDVNNKYIKKYIDTCEKVLGESVVEKGCETTSDAIFFSDKGIPTVIMNPTGYNPHCKNEYVNKESLYTLYKIYESFLGGNYE